MSEMTGGVNKWAWRFYLMLTLLALALSALLLRLVYLQLGGNEHGRLFLQKQGDMRVVRTESISADRGEILDRHGRLLAYSTPVKSIWMNPSVFASAYHDERAAEKVADLDQLAAALKLSSEQLGRRISANNSYVFLRRQLDPDRADKVLELKLPGVYAKTEYKRYYPAAEVASHIVGFTDVEDRGQEGIELAFDELLAGTDGRRRVMRNALGETIKDIRLLQPAEPGKPLQLSLDMKLQYIAYKALKAAVEQHGARSGSMVILDVLTGEVLALVNQPSYNVNDRSQLLPGFTRNRALIDVFEPGSTVKPFTVAAALETAGVTAQTSIDTSPGYIHLGNKTIVDPRDYGVLDVAAVLEKSSQVGITKLALSIEPDSLRDMFFRMGFGEHCATGFPGEQVGFLPNQRHWQPVQRAALSYGHGMEVNTLQLARAYAVLAADGLKRPVTLLKRSEYSDTGSEQVLDKELSKTVRSMMVNVIEQGTGKAAKIPGYSVAGKTGTSHKVGSTGYEQNRYRATFAGMVPASAPRLVAVTTVNDPQGEQYYGGEIAAPVFADVMRSAVRLLGIAPDRPHELDASYTAGASDRAVNATNDTGIVKAGKAAAGSA